MKRGMKDRGARLYHVSWTEMFGSFDDEMYRYMIPSYANATLSIILPDSRLIISTIYNNSDNSPFGAAGSGIIAPSALSPTKLLELSPSQTLNSPSGRTQF